jgi:hypothetical protein
MHPRYRDSQPHVVCTTDDNEVHELFYYNGNWFENNLTQNHK